MNGDSFCIEPSDSNGGGGGGGATGVISVPVRMMFLVGGSIAQWNLWPALAYLVTYYPSNGTNTVSGPFYEFVYSSAGGDVVTHFEYEADVDVVVTPRLRHADGTITNKPTVTLSGADVAVDITVTLAPGDSLGYHFAPVGGIVTYNFLRVFV